MKKLQIFILITFCSLNIWGQITKKTAEENSKNPSAQKEQINNAAGSAVSKEEYEIYMLMLAETKQNLVIRDKTALDGTRTLQNKSFVKELFKELDDETFENLHAKNRESSPLERMFPIKVNYTLISIEELKESFGYKADDQMNWESFYHTYPGSKGVFTLSRVGFNKNHNQALLFVAHWWGNLCGTGNLYFFRKVEGVWQNSPVLPVWVSKVLSPNFRAVNKGRRMSN